MRKLFMLVLPIIAMTGLAVVGIAPASASTAKPHPGHALRIVPTSASTAKPHLVIRSSVSPEAPADTVSCGGNVDKPYQYGHGAPVTGEANIICTPHAPDVCSITVRVWWYNTPQKKYEILVEHTSNSCGTDWWVKAGPKACKAKNPWAMHTQIVGQVFYGNWIDLSGNSPAVTLYC
jgi:hypothetical protein